jgi:hypothetical protein
MGLLTLKVLTHTINRVIIKIQTINKVPQKVFLLKMLLGIKSKTKVENL